MGNQLLLLEDIDDLGRSGEIVSVKPGYARNFLIPRKKAIIANSSTLKMQARLKEERHKQAAADKAASEKLAEGLKEVVLLTKVKVDPEGRMYGSVSSLDITRMLQERGIDVEKRFILLTHPIKEIGEHTIHLKLKEAISASFKLQIVVEGTS